MGARLTLVLVLGVGAALGLLLWSGSTGSLPLAGPDAVRAAGPRDAVRAPEPLRAPDAQPPAVAPTRPEPRADAARPPATGTDVPAPDEPEPLPGRVEGIVTAPDGRPLPGARVAFGGNGFAFGGDASVVADDEGRFALDGVPPGTVFLLATPAAGDASGLAASERLPVALASGGRVTGVRLVARAGGRLTGVVLAADEAPAPGREVELYNWSAGFRETVRTDADGAFALGGLPAGTFQVRSEATPDELAELESSGAAREQLAAVLRRQATARVEVGGDAHVILALPDVRPVRVRGTLEAGGRPLAEHVVSARFADGRSPRNIPSTRSDATGAFELVLPWPGAYRFSARDGASGTTYPSAVDVPASSEHRVRLAFAVGAISGTLRAANGAAAAGVEVVAVSSAGRGTARSEASGRYRIEDLPAGTYSVRPGSDPRFADADAQHVDVLDGEEMRALDFELAPGGAIAGRVLGPGGEPVTSGQLAFPGSPQVAARVFADAAGRFRVDGLPAGPLAIAAAASQAVCVDPVAVDVVAGEVCDVELRLVPAVRLPVRVLDADGAAVRARLEVLGAPAGTTVQPLEGGRFRVGLLPSGRYTLRATRGAAVVTREVEVDGRRAPRTLELRLPVAE